MAEKNKAKKNETDSKPLVPTLCNFIVTELVHDYGLKIENTVPGPQNIHMISSLRYNANKDSFNKILTSGASLCTKQNFTKYDEPGILKYIVGSTIKSIITDGSVHNKEITINGKKYHVTVVKRYSLNKAEEPNDGFMGGQFFENLQFGNYAPLGEEQRPVIVPDYYGGIYNTFKQGDPSKHKIYIFSPLVVRADSAGKANITDEKKMKPYFDTVGGITLINVIDNTPFTIKPFDEKLNPNGFFSNYTVKTSLIDGNIEQEWTDPDYKDIFKRNPANETNNKPNTFKEMSPLINDLTGNDPTLQKNKNVLETIANANNPSKNNNKANLKANEKPKIYLAKLNRELQSKRSGDWLPPLYILNFDDISQKIGQVNLKTYTNPKVAFQNIPETDKKKYFVKKNMYVLTHDTPLVAYSLYKNLNVLYITHDGSLVKFEADPTSEA